MAHTGCMTHNRLTREEEDGVTRWLLTQFKERPKDWVFDQYTCSDRKTGLAVWIGNGQWAVSIYRPIRTAYFRRANRRKLWHGMHAMRHAEPGTSRSMTALMDAGVTLPPAPPTWRERVAAMLRRPEKPVALLPKPQQVSMPQVLEREREAA